MNVVDYVRRMQTGNLSATKRVNAENTKMRQYFDSVQHNLASKLELSEYKAFQTAHKSAVNCLAIDKSEERYLLSGSSDCTIGLYDTQDPLYSPKLGMTTYAPIATIGKKGGHKYSVSCVEWYAHDNGIFLTGSFDKTIKAWDANRLQPAFNFRLQGTVYSIAISPIATQHNLVAGGTDNSIIRLCDLTNGTSTQTLIGHKSGTWAVKWSPTNEYILASGSADQTIRLWDIRRPGWLMCFDQFNTPGNPKEQADAHRFSTKKLHSTTRVPLAHNGAVTALCFTPDGKYLLSTSNDNRMRLWDVATGKNTLVHYSDTINTQQKGNQIAVSNDGGIVYHPNGNDVFAYDLFSGRVMKKLIGHYSGVNCCVFHPRDPELYTGANDHQIFVWSSQKVQENYKQSQDELGTMQQKMIQDKDEWSDDD